MTKSEFDFSTMEEGYTSEEEVRTSYAGSLAIPRFLGMDVSDLGVKSEANSSSDRTRELFLSFAKNAVPLIWSFVPGFGIAATAFDIASSLFVRETASSDVASEENQANVHRRELFERLTDTLVQLVRESDLEYGFTSELDSFLHERFQANAAVTREWLNAVYNRYQDDIAVQNGILRTIARLDWDQINPEGPTMALAALSHANVEVREAGIRALESWGNLEALEMLRNRHCPEPWLQDYLMQVIGDLEEELLTDVVSRKDD